MSSVQMTIRTCIYHGQWVYYVTSFYTYIFNCGVYFKERSVG